METDPKLSKGKDVLYKPPQGDNLGPDTSKAPYMELLGTIKQENQTAGWKLRQRQNPEEKQELVDHYENVGYQPKSELPQDQVEKDGPKLVENKEYQDLLDKYGGKMIHGTRTLDEAYYHSLSTKDVDRRNRDQVVTKRVRKQVPNEENPWRILCVGQLWLWVIDESAFMTVHFNSKTINTDSPIYRHNYH